MSISNNKEYALFISDPLDLRHWNSRHYTRIYFGTEICDRLLPTKSQLKHVLCFCKENNLDFSLVTPYCTNSTLKKIEPLLDCLQKNTEVVFNDFGLLKPIKTRQLNPVLGRLLVSVARDPRIPTDNKDFNSYYKTSNIQRPLLTFLQNKKILRIELDNIKQGYDLPFQIKTHLSLYTPYVYSAITRKCIFSNLAQSNAFFQVSPPCHRECEKETLKVEVSNYQEFIYIKGTAEYYINHDENLPCNPCIDRIIYMPVFPHNSFKPYKNTAKKNAPKS